MSLSLSTLVSLLAFLSFGCGVFSGCVYPPDEGGRVEWPITELTIHEKAFKECKEIISIYIPKSVEKIGREAFANAPALMSVEFEANSSLTIIGAMAFSGCQKLTTIDIPKSVEGDRIQYFVDKMAPEIELQAPLCTTVADATAAVVAAAEVHALATATATVSAAEARVAIEKVVDAARCGCTHTPSQNPSQVLSNNPSQMASFQPSSTTKPSLAASYNPSQNPSYQLSSTPSGNPSQAPSDIPTPNPSFRPSFTLSQNPSQRLSDNPSPKPSFHPSSTFSQNPSQAPSESPSQKPSFYPSSSPSLAASYNPSQNPSYQPSSTPSGNPSQAPSDQPSVALTTKPSDKPTVPTCETWFAFYPDNTCVQVSSVNTEGMTCFPLTEPPGMCRVCVGENVTEDAQYANVYDDFVYLFVAECNASNV